jgi:hypothetical protein
MTNQIISVDDGFGNITEHIIIDRGNGEFTSMPKALYDEQQAQAEHFTPSLTDADKS